MSTTSEGAPDLAAEIARLANAFFQGAGPAPGMAALPVPEPSVPPRVGPSALAPGGPGASPLVSAPPIPGLAKALPPVETPLPREADLRSPAGAVAEHGGFGTSAVPMVAAFDASPFGGPYYLSHLGQPATALPSGLPMEVPGPVPVVGSVPATGSVPAAEPRLPGASSLFFTPEVVALGTPARTALGPSLDGHVVRRDFPLLQERVHGKRLVWLDNGATTQKPKCVIDRLSHYYEHENSNVHRGAHTLAARSTDAYEGARDKVRDFLGASTSESIVFTRGTTEAINLVAQTYGLKHLRQGDEVLITWLEHHANIVPWQQLCAATGARLRVAPVDDHGELIVGEFARLVSPRTRIASFTHVSNALGTINPVAELTQLAKRAGAAVLIDGAQSVSHMPVNVAELGCDFYVFSGHKVFAPTGIGALYGRPEVLADLPPWQGGGNMIADVTFERTQYQPPPWRFEAGTGSIADAVGLGAAIDYVRTLGMENIERYEQGLLTYATAQLTRIPGLTLYGKAAHKAAVLSFTLAGYTTEEVGKALDQEGVAVRSGHHCAQPILRRMGVESTVRATFAPYNTCEDVDILAEALQNLRRARG